MAYTMLVDLDDTLLKNSIDSFLPQYLKAWGRFVAPYIDPEKFIDVLMAGTRAMVLNRNPDCTLQEAFEATFFPNLGIEPELFREMADRFYAEVFPLLKTYTQPIPEAAPVVGEMMRRGYPVVVATNPLFPQEAVQQRLGWAGLPVDQFPFDLVASYESFHFVKPDPAFFAEALAKLGWPEGPAVIVGDDVEREVIAGRKLGLPVFWISKDGIKVPAEADGPTACGTLKDLLPWLDRNIPEGLAPDFNSPAALLAILRSTAAATDSFCRDLSPEQWVLRPSDEEWSLTETLCHLRDVDAEVNLRRVKKVLDEQNPFLPGEDTDPWAQERGYIKQNGFKALRQFMGARMELVSLLQGLDERDWQRPARHAIFGPTRLIELVSIVAAHDRVHVRQVKSLV